MFEMADMSGMSLLRISLVAGDVRRVHSLVEEHPSV